MTTPGYQKKRFRALEGDAFDCSLCNNVAKEPRECHGCGTIYCNLCVMSQPNKKCARGCNAEMTPLTSKVLIKMYNNLDIECRNYDQCKRVCKMSDLAKHQSECGKTKCWNAGLCQKAEASPNPFDFPCCSNACALLKEVMNAGKDNSVLYRELQKFLGPGSNIKKIESAIPPSGQVLGSLSSINTVGEVRSAIKWDSKCMGSSIQLTDGGESVFLKEQPYVFRTVLGDVGFMGGMNYWEIVADSRTENELKIGVSTNNKFDFNSAFCDHAFGFAYYGLGQLRHGSNATGPTYGKRFKKEGVLGVCLNMNKGTLSFALNGESMGVAFTHESLKKGPIYPAVSLLHCAGCKIRVQPLPSYFRE